MPRGSLPGERRGGRKAGTPNHKNAERIEAARASGLMPLDYMLQVLRDELSKVEDKRWAANAAAPYVHPRLAATEIKMPEKIVHEVRVTIAKR